MKHLDRYNILTDAQHGFRKRRSCECQLILTFTDLASSMDLKEQIDLILLDFSKALIRFHMSGCYTKWNITVYEAT